MVFISFLITRKVRKKFVETFDKWLLKISEVLEISFKKLVLLLLLLPDSLLKILQMVKKTPVGPSCHE